MKTLHRIIDAIFYLAWLSLFIMKAISIDNMLAKIICSLAAFIVAAYLFMSMFYGIVRFKPNTIILVVYIILLICSSYFMFKEGATPEWILLNGISILGVFQYIINRKIESQKKKELELQKHQ